MNKLTNITKIFISIMFPLGIYRGYNLARYNNKSLSIKIQTICLTSFFYLHPVTIPFILHKEYWRITNKNKDINDFKFVSLF